MAFQLHIPEPCNENWDEMTPNEQGRFCLHCQKTVIDFSVMTDTEIIHFFQHRKEKVCGRFHTQQLAEVYPEPKLVPRFKWIKAVATLFTGLLSLHVYSQTQTLIQQTPVEQLAVKSLTQPNTDSLIIRGNVIDKLNKTGVYNAVIVLHLNNKTELKTYSDYLGNFQFQIDSLQLLKDAELIVWANQESFVFASNTFDFSLPIICEIDYTAYNASTVEIIAYKRPPFTKEAISGVVSTTTVYSYHLRRKYNPYNDSNHYYRMQEKIKNVPTVFTRE